MELLHPPLRSALRLPFDPALKVYWDIPGLLGTMPCMSVVALVLAIGVLAWRVRNIPSEQVPPLAPRKERLAVTRRLRESGHVSARHADRRRFCVGGCDAGC